MPYVEATLYESLRMAPIGKIQKVPFHSRIKLALPKLYMSY